MDDFVKLGFWGITFLEVKRDPVLSKNDIEPTLKREYQTSS